MTSGLASDLNAVMSAREQQSMIDIDSPSEIKKRSVVIEGHRTSISLENIFWETVRDIATSRGLSVNQLITEIDSARTGNLSSAIRTYVLQQKLLH